MEYVILKLEKSPHDYVDHYRADKFCKAVHYDRIIEESKTLGPQKTYVEALFHSISSTREHLNGRITAGKISFAVASAIKPTENREDLHWGYIPSLPPLTVPLKRFVEYLNEDMKIVKASDHVAKVIRCPEGYEALVTYIWILLAGWVQKEGIEVASFDHFRRQLMTRDIFANVLLYLNISIPNIDRFHDDYFDAMVGREPHELRGYFGEGRRQIVSEKRRLHY